MKRTTLRSLIPLMLMLALLTTLIAPLTSSLAADMLNVSMTLDKGPVIQSGEQVKVTLTPSGGRPPYTYRHKLSIYEQGEVHLLHMEDGPDNTATWPIDFGERALFSGVVWDADGKVGWCDMAISIQGAEYNPLVITRESLSPGDSINLGDAIVYTVEAKGGQPPYTYGYKLNLFHDHCWSIPFDQDGFTDNSFSYAVTRGSKGVLYASVRDALGREAFSAPGKPFTIHGDNKSFGFSVVKRIEKIDDGKHRVTLQAELRGGTKPVMYYCEWEYFKNDKLTRKSEKNANGGFVLEADFDHGEARVSARDADGWTTNVELVTSFETKERLSIVSRSEWFDIAEMYAHLSREKWHGLVITPPGSSDTPHTERVRLVPALVDEALVSNPNRPRISDVPGKLLVPPSTTSPPRRVSPRLIDPEVVRPQVTHQIIRPPDLLPVRPLVP